MSSQPQNWYSIEQRVTFDHGWSMCREQEIGYPVFFYDNYYTLSEIAKLAYSTILTRIFNRNASLIRRPFYLRGKPRVEFGKGFTTGYNCRIEAFGDKQDRSTKIVFGQGCHIGDNVHIAAAEKVVIGDHCLFASKVFISDSGHGEYGASTPDSDPNTRPLSISPVTIGSNVWLGENVCILKGVTIGDGAVIGANSVVTKDIPPSAIAVGSPARVIKRYNDNTQTWESQSAR